MRPVGFRLTHLLVLRIDMNNDYSKITVLSEALLGCQQKGFIQWLGAGVAPP